MHATSFVLVIIIVAIGLIWAARSNGSEKRLVEQGRGKYMVKGKTGITTHHTATGAKEPYLTLEQAQQSLQLFFNELHFEGKYGNNSARFMGHHMPILYNCIAAVAAHREG